MVAVAAMTLVAADVAGTALGYLFVAVIILAILGWFVRQGTDIFTALKPGTTPTGGRCPFCGKGIKAGAYVCHHCGRDKRSQPRTRRVKCPTCSKPVKVTGTQGQTFNCPKCGSAATLTS